MKYSSINRLLVGVISLLIISCTSCTNEKTYSNWGDTDYYEDFLWSKYTPDTLKRTICCDFNKDAQRLVKSPLKLGFFKKNEVGDLVQVSESEAEIFVNGQPNPTTIIEIMPSDKEVEVGMVLKNELRNTKHHWYLKIVDAASLDRINDDQASTFEEANSILNEITITKHECANPLAKGLLITLLVILVGIALWLLILKQVIYPTFKISGIVLEGPAPFTAYEQVRRCRKLVLTAAPKKQSTLNRIFTGRIKYLKNRIWTSDVQFEPRDRSSIRILHHRDYTIESRILRKSQDYYLEHPDHKNRTKIIIQ